MVKFILADGREGLPQEGPFDIIIVGGGIFDAFFVVSFSNKAVKELPEHFLDQLAQGGSMVTFYLRENPQSDPLGGSSR